MIIFLTKNGLDSIRIDSWFGNNIFNKLYFYDYNRDVNDQYIRTIMESIVYVREKDILDAGLI